MRDTVKKDVEGATATLEHSGRVDVKVSGENGEVTLMLLQGRFGKWVALPPWAALTVATKLLLAAVVCSFKWKH